MAETKLKQQALDITNWIDFSGTINPTGYASMTYTAVTITKAEYVIIGNILFYTVFYYGTTGGTPAPRLVFTLPVAPVGNIGSGCAKIYDNSTDGAGMITSSATTAYVWRYDGASWGLGTQRYVEGSGFYKIA